MAGRGTFDPAVGDLWLKDAMVDAGSKQRVDQLRGGEE